MFCWLHDSAVQPEGDNLPSFRGIWPCLANLKNHLLRLLAIPTCLTIQGAWISENCSSPAELPTLTFKETRKTFFALAGIYPTRLDTAKNSDETFPKLTTRLDPRQKRNRARLTFIKA